MIKNIKCVENMTTATSTTACSLELIFGTSPQSAQRAVVCQNHEPGKLAWLTGPKISSRHPDKHVRLTSENEHIIIIERGGLDQAMDQWAGQESESEQQ